MNPLITLDEKELEKIQSLLPGSQRPIQVGFRAKVRAEKKQYDDAICILSSHYIYVFVPSKNKEDSEYRNIMTTHISLVSSISLKDESVIIGIEQKNLKIESDHKYEFAQVLYRNYFLSFLFLETEDDIDFYFNGKENNSERDKRFPLLDSLPISLSQQFQFNYFANCTEEEKARYNHAAVRYVHSMITTQNTIFDASMLPEKLLNGKNAKENLRQIFAVLSMMKTISGICLSNYDCPDIISTFSSLIPNLKSLRIVHLSNCGATTGLDELAESIINANNLNVSYWDLSYNKFKNFKPFSKIISNSKKAIKYINLNYCEISHSGSVSFFNALSNFKFVGKLRYLSIAKMSLSDDDSITAFRNFLKVSNLFYIDLSSMEEEISAVLKALTEEEQPKLRSLILNKLPLDDGIVILINRLIESSNTLEELSLSGSTITPGNLASIITTINENKAIKSFSLNLDKMNLGGNIDVILDAFLMSTSNKNKKKSKKKEEDDNNNDYISKWRKLSFASNSLDENDLDDLIKSISNFNNLVEINLDNNFNSSMKDIDNILCHLLDFEKLVSISIAGSKNNRLKGKLEPLLSAIANSGNIQKLDIRNNDFNDISCIKKLIKKCKGLSVFRCDNNGFSNLKEIVPVISKIKKLTEFNFPINDCKKLIKNVDVPDDQFINDVENYMRDLMVIVEKNRRKQELYCELPFKTSVDVEQIISDLSVKAHQNLESFDLETATEHSYVTEIFGLPFPCQKLLMLLRNERDKSSLFSNRQKFYKNENIEPYGETDKFKVPKDIKNSYYAADSMNKVLIENPDIAGLYPEFYANPIVGGQIKEFFDNLLLAQDLENESKSPETTQNRSRSNKLDKSGKIAERGAELSNSDPDDDQNYDESSSSAQKGLNKTQRYLIRGKDNQAEDEKTRIQFRNANLREVDDISLNLETRCIDNEKLDQLMGSSSDEMKEVKSNRTKISKNVSRNNRAKDRETTPSERPRISSERRLRDSNNDFNKTGQRRRINDNDDEDSDKDKSIIKKKQKILSNPDYANSSSDDEHIEKLRRQNLKGSGKRKTDQQKQQPQPQPKPQPEPEPEQQQPIQKKNKKHEEEEEENDEKQKKVVNKRRVIIPSSESSSEDNAIIKNQKISRKNVSDSENDEDEVGNNQINKSGRKNINNRSSKQQQVLINSSDSENNEETNKRSRKRSSNSKQRKQQQQYQEEEEIQERRRQQQQEQERRRKQQEELERRRKQEEEEEEQERLRQSEKRRQQQEQEDEEKQQKIAKKQTPPPPSKKDQSLRALLNSSSEELSNSEEERNKVPPKRAPQNQRSIQRPPNQPDPGLAMDYAHNLLEENEKKPRPSKIPLYRKTQQ